MASIGEIAGNIAHEFNSPLAVIIGRLTQLERLLLGPAEIDRSEALSMVREMSSVSVRATAIIRGMRRATRDGSNDFTTKPVGKGTGLGLNIAKRIVEDHGGTIAIDRESGHTRFVLALPKRQRSQLNDEIAQMLDDLAA